MSLNIKEMMISILGGELLEAVVPRIFDPGAVKAKEKKEALKGEKANIFGFGKQDEQLFWKAADLAIKPYIDKSGTVDTNEGKTSMAEIRIVTDFSMMTNAQKRTIILYIGHKEDIREVGEEQLNADNSPDLTKNVKRKGDGGKAAAKIVVTQIVANTDGRRKIIFLTRLMRHELGYTDAAAPTKTFSAKEKIKAKNAIKEWLINSGMFRDTSEQIEESAKELKQTILAVCNKLGFKYKHVDDLNLKINSFFAKSKLALAKAKNKR